MKKRGTKPHHNPRSKSTKILKHLLDGNAMTSVDAFKDFNTTRLSAVIKIFRDLGYKIETNYKPNSKLGIYSMNPMDDGINILLWEKRYHQSQSVKAVK